MSLQATSEVAACAPARTPSRAVSLESSVLAGRLHRYGDGDLGPEASVTSPWVGPAGYGRSLRHSIRSPAKVGAGTVVTHPGCDAEPDRYLIA